ncbi:protein SSX9-like [Otolemur garnettii]|uniref:protein SSX9-like n=1 Tax=Otolemur garnettii TaxID=30611 RepID=UPI00027421FE|nr:protein SSX9-like [Otolemur garnettii]
MNRSGPFLTGPREDAQKSQKKCKAFKDISKYFPKEEWDKLRYSEKITYVYMKRNYDTMTRLGLNAALPDFMCPERKAVKSQDQNSGDDSHRDQNEPLQGASDEQQSKRPKMMPSKQAKKGNDAKEMPGTSGSEQAKGQHGQQGKERTSGKKTKKTSGKEKKKGKSVWAHRLRERKNFIIYEEISDPEEED